MLMNTYHHSLQRVKCTYLITLISVIVECSKILTGMSNNSLRAVEESTCRFVQMSRTNIVISTFQEQGGEKRTLDTESLPTESNAAKRNHSDGATLNFSSSISSQVVGFPNILI